jgi:RNA processing factor Prp31
MSAALDDPQTRFWYAASTVALQARDHGQWSLYERLKSWYVREFPEADHVEYEAAMRRISKMTGA